MKKLMQLLSELHPERDINGKDRLIDDGILDSLDIVTLVTDINIEYGISIGAEDIVKDNFDSADSIAALIKRCGGKIK